MGQDDLRSILSKLPSTDGMGDLLVGTSTADDAAVLRIVGDTAIAQTVDFFTPIVDDPYLFGQIAATNAISDIYAMGATPILGLAIAGFPTDKLPLEVLEEILRGGADKAIEAGFPVAGGHTIIDDVPKYGLVVTGIVKVGDLLRNSTARVGDALYLTKPIGNGILVSAYRAATAKRFFRKDPPSLDEATRWMTTLNRDAAKIMVEERASAATDVTGYGLIGHLLEMCEGSGVGATISASAVPVLREARELLARGYRPEGTERNVTTFRGRVHSQVPESELTLLCDAQTSGGLLIAIAPEQAAGLERRFEESGLFYAKVGSVTGDVGHITIVV
ncbi:MAG TPA: selenide, water dikinase SelD [Thermoanaerobaculia bacterium]